MTRPRGDRQGTEVDRLEEFEDLVAVQLAALDEVSANLATPSRLCSISWCAATYACPRSCEAIARFDGSPMTPPVGRRAPTAWRFMI
jgi:hypothetical protein